MTRDQTGGTTSDESRGSLLSGRVTRCESACRHVACRHAGCSVSREVYQGFLWAVFALDASSEAPVPVYSCSGFLHTDLREPWFSQWFRRVPVLPCFAARGHCGTRGPRMPRPRRTLISHWFYQHPLRESPAPGRQRGSRATASGEPFYVICLFSQWFSGVPVIPCSAFFWPGGSGPETLMLPRFLHGFGPAFFIGRTYRLWSCLVQLFSCYMSAT